MRPARAFRLLVVLAGSIGAACGGSGADRAREQLHRQHDRRRPSPATGRSHDRVQRQHRWRTPYRQTAEELRAWPGRADRLLARRWRDERSDVRLHWHGRDRRGDIVDQVGGQGTDGVVNGQEGDLGRAADGHGESSAMVHRGWRRRSVGLPGLRIMNPSGAASSSGMWECPNTTTPAPREARAQSLASSGRGTAVVHDADPQAGDLDLRRLRQGRAHGGLLDVAPHRHEGRAEPPHTAETSPCPTSRPRGRSDRRRAAARSRPRAARGRAPAGGCRR